MKPSVRSVLIAFVFLCLSAGPKAQAVVPAPDGGYPGANTAEGQNALFSLTTGTYNTAVGLFSLKGNTTGSYNTAVGAGTLLANTALENTATGFGALLSNTTGPRNTANGALTLFSNSTGDSNTAIGAGALAHNTTGRNNVALGFNAGLGVTTANNVICIGVQVGGADVSNSCFIGNIFTATSSGGIAVLVNSNGRLGTATSSRRFKDAIQPVDQASEALFALKPVTFHYKKEIDPAGTPQLGLVAEDVEKVNPDLVVRDKEGKPYSVRYDQVNAMLLNEFLKEHRKVQKLEATVTDLAATVKEQAAQLQSVSAQLQMNIRTAQVAAVNH